MHEALSGHLYRNLADRATGRSEELILDNRPRNVLFAGCLMPRPDATEDNLESAEDFYARLAPSAIQVRFLVRGDARARIDIRPRFHVYYRVIPPFHAQDRRTPKGPDGGPMEEKLVKAYRKFVPSFPPVREKMEIGERPIVQLGPIINEALATAVGADPEALRPGESWKVPANALADQGSFRRFWAAASGDPLPPVFRVHLHVEVSESHDQAVRQITVSLVNRSEPHAEFDKNDYWEQAIFDAGVEASIVDGGAAFEPYVFAALPNSYRFDRDQWGVGVNCVTEISSNRSVIRTSTVPTFRQKALEHRTLARASLKYETLVREPLAELERLLEQMQLYRSSAWEEKRRELQARPDYEVIRSDFDRDLADFQSEVEEFRSGLDVLKDPRRAILLKAFVLMNDTFMRLGKSTAWRLFQLVFIVRNLPVLAAREWTDVNASEDVEVLWFPTGGGKTEAFLGLLITALFFDRLRDRQEGTTGLLRLPLRLLSLQQFQRVVRIVAVADQVRQRTVGGKEFSVGYWIGQGGSPNKVEPKEGAEWEQDPSACQKYRKVRQCPYCDAEVSLRFDRARWTLVHRCSSGKCGNGGDLPLYIVDDDLYRFLPSVVVGTVDKLAAFGFQQRFSNLLGWAAARCPRHGFTPRLECLVPGCRQKVVSATIKDPVPSLHVQDELHLLKEDLGAFDGHYETAVLKVQEHVPNGRPWKIIAATATIEQYDWHVSHLYCKTARRFPCPGPSWGDTFYATTQDRLSRIFIGLLPFNRSHINSMISLLWYFHSELLHLRNRLAADAAALCLELGVSPDTPAHVIERTIRDYEISLTYVLTRKAGDQMAESLATQIAGYLRDEGQEPLETRSLTGQSTGEDIEAILAAIDRSAQRPVGQPAEVDAVIATSMISHGVDIERFNFISFFGMPRMTAEYIQASSRVGRAFPGLVVVVFSPARERDRSHFHHFEKYHQYLERLVEPAAINRWARFAVKHTLPGIVIGYLINVLGRRSQRKLYMENELHAALHIDRLFTVDSLIAEIKSFYMVDLQESGALAKQIEQGIELFLNGLRKNARRTLWQQSDFRPMYSLRDVEDPVYFTPSNYSREAFAVWMAKRHVKQGELGLLSD